MNGNRGFETNGDAIEQVPARPVPDFQETPAAPDNNTPEPPAKPPEE